MKGVIFSIFNELVEEKWGLEAWEKLLEKVKPPSGGAYTAGATYPDEELFSLVGALSAQTRASVEDLVRAFGEYTFHRLAKLYPVFIRPGMKAKDFLKTVDQVIHIEVRKLYPEAETPEFRTEEPAPDRLVMIYRSTRKLCVLAEGLIDGAAKHFGEKVERAQTRCLHRGDDHCRLELRFS